ncbi:unnamed protein product [Chrysoparadoxa australica]
MVVSIMEHHAINLSLALPLTFTFYLISLPRLCLVLPLPPAGSAPIRPNAGLAVGLAGFAASQGQLIGVWNELSDLREEQNEIKECLERQKGLVLSSNFSDPLFAVDCPFLVDITATFLSEIKVKEMEEEEEELALEEEGVEDESPIVLQEGQPITLSRHHMVDGQ